MDRSYFDKHPFFNVLTEFGMSYDLFKRLRTQANKSLDRLKHGTIDDPINEVVIVENYNDKYIDYISKNNIDYVSYNSMIEYADEITETALFTLLSTLRVKNVKPIILEYDLEMQILLKKYVIELDGCYYSYNYLECYHYEYRDEFPLSDFKQVNPTSETIITFA